MATIEAQVSAAEAKIAANQAPAVAGDSYLEVGGMIGDLALVGRSLLGHVIAERAGHAMHVALVAKIMSDPSLYEVLSFDQLADRVAHALVS